jgi:hypothetical protein
VPSTLKKKRRIANCLVIFLIYDAASAGEFIHHRGGKREKKEICGKKYGQLNLYGTAISLPKNSDVYKIRLVQFYERRIIK